MSGIFQKMIELGITLGTINDAHLYDSGFISIDGVSHEGKKFGITLHFEKEEKEDA